VENDLIQMLGNDYVSEITFLSLWFLCLITLNEVPTIPSIDEMECLKEFVFGWWFGHSELDAWDLNSQTTVSAMKFSQTISQPLFLFWSIRESEFFTRPNQQGCSRSLWLIRINHFEPLVFISISRKFP